MAWLLRVSASFPWWKWKNRPIALKLYPATSWSSYTDYQTWRPSRIHLGPQDYPIRRNWWASRCLLFQNRHRSHEKRTGSEVQKHLANDVFLDDMKNWLSAGSSSNDDIWDKRKTSYWGVTLVGGSLCWKMFTRWLRAHRLPSHFHQPLRRWLWLYRLFRPRGCWPSSWPPILPQYHQPSPRRLRPQGCR